MASSRANQWFTKTLPLIRTSDIEILIPSIHVGVAHR
jgi:hypothetical protein